jgi:hypothetical protein
LVVQLRYGKGSAHAGPQDPDEPPPAKDALMEDTGQAGVSQRPSGPVDTPQQNLAPGPVAAASVTTPGFPSVPALQVPSQPAASKPTGLPMSALLNAPEPAPQVSTKAYHQPQAPEGPKTGHPVAVNGWNGSHQGAEHRPGSELPRAQAPPTS